MKPDIIKDADLSETNIIQWDEKLEDGKKHTRWSVFTSDFDVPPKWEHQGWGVSSICNMGYQTIVWETTNPDVVRKDLGIFKITQKAYDQLNGAVLAVHHGLNRTG